MTGGLLHRGVKRPLVLLGLKDKNTTTYEDTNGTLSLNFENILKQRLHATSKCTYIHTYIHTHISIVQYLCYDISPHSRTPQWLTMLDEPRHGHYEIATTHHDSFKYT